MIFSEKSKFLFLVFGRAIQAATSLFALHLTTNLLGQEELGKVYYILSIQAFFALFLINPVGQYFNRKTNYWFQNKVVFSAYVKQSKYILYITFFSIVFLYFLRDIWNISLENRTIALISLLIASQSINQTIIPLFNMLNYRGYFVVLTILTSVLSVILSLIFVKTINNTAFSWLLGIVAGNFILLVISSVMFRKKIIGGSTESDNNLEFKWNKKDILRFSLPISVATLGMWFVNSGYRILVEKHYGLEYLSYIGVGIAIASQIFALAESLITQYFLPILYKNVEGAKSDKRVCHINSYLNKVIPIYFSLGIFFTFSIKAFLPFLVGKQYYGVIEVAIYGIWIEFSRVTTNALSIICQIENNTKLFPIPFFKGSAFTIVGVSFIKIGVDHFTNLLLISAAIVLVSMFFLMKKIISFNFPIRNIICVLFATIPSVLFFRLIDIEANFSVDHFFYCGLGGIIYLSGLSFFWWYFIYSAEQSY